MTGIYSRRWPFMLVVVLVCLAAGLTNWYCGGAAAAHYREYESMSFSFGDAFTLLNPLHVLDNFSQSDRGARMLCGAGGLAAGAVWCGGMAYMARRARKRGGPRRSLIVRGVVLGVVVGVLCSLAVHAGLQVRMGRFSASSLRVGAMLGLTVGALMGLVCSLLFTAAARLAARKA